MIVEMVGLLRRFHQVRPEDADAFAAGTAHAAIQNAVRATGAQQPAQRLRCTVVVRIMEAVIRHLPVALGNNDSVAEESFSDGLGGMIEYPHYTRPRVYGAAEVPAVLLSGDHAAIARWRRENARPSPWSGVARTEGGSMSCDGVGGPGVHT